MHYVLLPVDRLPVAVFLLLAALLVLDGGLMDNALEAAASFRQLSSHQIHSTFSVLFLSVFSGRVQIGGPANKEAV